MSTTKETNTQSTLNMEGKEMTNEVREKVNHAKLIAKIKKNVTALYLLSDLTEVWEYLWAVIDDERITEEEADKILEEAIAKCVPVTVAEINKIKALF